jgi:hypothetical protein
VIFIDPRQQKGLDKEGRRFTFSVMNEFIREQNPDLADVQLAIMNFTPKKKDARVAKLFIEEEERLLSYSEILSKTQDVYRIWDQVISEKQGAPRKKSGGSGGFL